MPDRFASFVDAEGRRWCISHNPNKAAKLLAVHKGGAAWRQKAAGVLPPGTPPPVWRTREDVVTWAEETAGKVLRKELDKTLAAEARQLAGLALVAHDMAARDLLEKLSKAIGPKVRRA